MKVVLLGSPWTVRPHPTVWADREIVDADGRVFARVQQSAAEKVDEDGSKVAIGLSAREMDERASLMMSAPALLEALEKIVAGPGPDCNSPEDQCRWDEKIARAALSLVREEG